MVLHACRALLVAGLVGLLASVAAAVWDPYPLGAAVPWVWLLGAVLPTYLVGAVALLLRPDHLTARWLAALGSFLALATALSRAPPLAGLPETVGWLAAANTLQVAAMLATAASVASLLIAFPDAAYRHRYQRWLTGLVWVVMLAVPAVWLLAHPYLYLGSVVWPEARIPNPLHVAALAQVGEVAAAALRWRAAVWLIGGVALVVRYRAASPGVRAQFRWPLMAAVGFALLLGLFAFVQQLGLLPQAPQGLPQFNGWVPGLALLSGSVLAALLHHRLLEVDLWLRRSLLFGGLSALVALGYLGLAGLAGLAAGQRASLGVGVLVTLAAMLVFEPVRRRIDGWSRRLVFGDRMTGEQLLRRVGGVLEDTHDTARLGTTLVATIVDGLDLQWARIWLYVDEGGPSVPVASVGIPEGESAGADLVVPLTHAGTTVGHIECGPKRHGQLSRADEELLVTVARQAALAVRNAGLTVELERRLDELARQAEELAASRSRIVQAQNSERRRIERDLHDGVQQDVVASIAKIRLVRNQLARDPQRAAATLVELQEHTRRTLESLRELSRGIHPLVLTHHGLVAALRAQVGRMPIDVRVDAAPQVSATRYAEDVEAAAYFVACEGLTNVIKHAGTDWAAVTLDCVDGHLVVEVADGGHGCVPAMTAGSGLVGLRDRVESLGGSLELHSRLGHGAVLRSRLPAHREVTSRA